MTTPPRPPSPSASTTGSRARFVAAILGVVVIAVAVGTWIWLRPHPPLPPLPDYSGVDPEVVTAITTARDDVTARPSSEQAWGRLGMVLLAHDFEEEAVVCFQEAERLGPRQPRWPYLQGLILVRIDPDAGILCFERAVERCADDPIVPRVRLAEALLERGRLEEAQTHLERAILRDPDSIYARFWLGRLALLRENWIAALEHLAACIEDKHARKLAHTLRADLWNRLGEAEKARAEQERAALLPDDVRWPDPFVSEVLELKRGLRARLESADSLTREGKTGEVIVLLEETAGKYPKSAETWMRLGDLWRISRRLDRAEESFRRATQVDPEAAEPWFRLGTVYQAQGQPREAADNFRRAIRLRPDHALAHFDLGHCLNALGDPPGAANEYREALRCRPDFTPAMTALTELESSRQSP
jgi:tetratricopeptide (TPR) repeat protein